MWFFEARFGHFLASWGTKVTKRFRYLKTPNDWKLPEDSKSFRSPYREMQRLCQFLCQICGPTGKIWKIGTFSFVTFEPQEIRKWVKVPFVQLGGANTMMWVWAWSWRHADVIECQESELCTNRKEFMKLVVLCAKILLIWSIEKEGSGMSVPFTVVPQWDKIQKKVPKWGSRAP